MNNTLKLRKSRREINVSKNGFTKVLDFYRCGGHLGILQMLRLKHKVQTVFNANLFIRTFSGLNKYRYSFNPFHYHFTQTIHLVVCLRAAALPHQTLKTLLPGRMGGHLGRWPINPGHGSLLRHFTWETLPGAKSHET